MMGKQTAKMSHPRKKRRKKLILVTVLCIGFLALAAGAAHAAMKSIQLNSPATFPVDI